MKKVGIVTIQDNDNYGNRLQNYATQEVIKSMGVKTISLKNVPTLNIKDKFLIRILKFLKDNMLKLIKKKSQREKSFEQFNKMLSFSKTYITPYSKISSRYDYFLVGSDQVWNPNISRLRDVDLLSFAKDSQKIAFSASFAVNQIPENMKKTVEKELKSFKAISVREDAGKKIIDELTGRKDVTVLIDPTMLLTSDDWDKVAKRPEQLKNDRYILNYFLGDLSPVRKEEINRIAKENNCQVINILDKNSPFYQTGPSEFVYLEKHAFLICTDSFHSSVFAILYNRPFIVFEREDNTVSMNSRIETLINKFHLEDRRFANKIKEDNLKCDYTEAYKVLEEERKKVRMFLKKELEWRNK